MLTAGSRRAAACSAAALCAVIVGASAICGCGSRGPGSGVAEPAGPGKLARCVISLRTFPAAADFPGFTEYARVPKLSFPAQPRPGSPPSPLQREYVCGAVAGFLADISLTGKYRQENNARAKSLGYTVGKWPGTPLSGSIVGQQRHKVLEIYVSAVQFASARAAMSYADPPPGPSVAGGLAFRLRPRPLHVLRLPGAGGSLQHI